MDLIKQLTGKNPVEYEKTAKMLVDNADEELFSALVKQDDFLFSFIKENVSKRIRLSCNNDNYKNLMKFLNYYSPSYDTMISEVLHAFSGDDLFTEMKYLFENGTDNQKAYAVKYFSMTEKELLNPVIDKLRETAYSDFEPLAVNSAEVLSICNDVISKQDAINKLGSEDEFIRYSAVKFLVNYQAKDMLNKIIEVMKTSSLSENVAIEIPYLVNLEDLYNQNPEACNLVICYILDAIPEIASLGCIVDYNLKDFFERIINEEMTSSAALLLCKAKSKFYELCQNDEYSYDSDKLTKDTLKEINEILKRQNSHKLENLLYEELYEESDFVLFAVDLINEPEALAELLDSKNPTLVLKIILKLKELKALTEIHKEKAIQNVENQDIISVIKVL